MMHNEYGIAMTCNKAICPFSVHVHVYTVLLLLFVIIDKLIIWKIYYYPVSVF